METVEQRGRVHGVSSKTTWKEDFPEHKSYYRKRRGGLPSSVDFEEMKRQMKSEMKSELRDEFKRELLGDLRPIFES